MTTIIERLLFTLAEAKKFCPKARMEVDFPFIDNIFSGVLDLMHHTLTTGGMELEVIFMLSYSSILSVFLICCWLFYIVLVLSFFIFKCSRIRHVLCYIV